NVAKTVSMIRQGVQFTPAYAQLILGVQHAGRRNHQMGFHPRRMLAHRFQHANGVNAACSPRYTDHKTPFCHASAPASFRTCASSPFSYISEMMSEPPMNSP